MKTGKMNRIKKKLAAIFAAAASLVFVLLAFSQAVIPLSAGNVEPDSLFYLEDGTYRIRNLTYGVYLTAQIYNSKKKAETSKIVLSALDRNDTGQTFFLKTAEDGSRYIVPRNDGAGYSLSSDRQTAEAGSLLKTSDRNSSCSFDVLYTDFGGYTIAPSFDSNIYSVITPVRGADGRVSSVSVDDYRVGNRAQLWVFERMEPSTELTVAYNYTKIRLYSTGKFYSRLKPYIGTDPAPAVWESSDSSVMLVGDDGSYAAVGEGKAVVTARAEGLSASFTVTVVDSECFTWYSQNNILTSDWYGGELTDLFMQTRGIKKRFAVDDNGRAAYTSWMDTGCALCSIAAVFHNLGATSKQGYDLRTGQTGGLEADPFTVGMANTLNFEMYDKSKTYSGDPSYMFWQRCADNFQLDGENIYYRSVYTQNRNTIKNLLKTHPQGLIAQLENRVRTHYVVIGECVNPDEKTSSKLEFMIYDPAAYAPEDGDGVLMKETTSSKYLSLGYYSITRLIIYDVESNYKN